jgi:hypothetical protein
MIRHLFRAGLAIKITETILFFNKASERLVLLSRCDWPKIIEILRLHPPGKRRLFQFEIVPLLQSEPDYSLRRPFGTETASGKDVAGNL